MLDDSVTVLIGLPRGSIRRMRSYGILYTKILRSDWAVLVVRSLGFLRNLLLTYFDMEHPTLTLDRLLDDEQYLNQWSNINVHYALVTCSINYVRWY